jgi:small redox-active disulfide protein 2
MIQIKILGTGCTKCRTLYENAQAGVALAGVQAGVEKVEKITDIIAYGVMNTPAIVIDQQVKSAGKVLSAEQIAEWLK